MPDRDTTAKRHDEAARLAALDSYAVLDTPPEQPFDDIVAIAARLCGTPTALVSLVDGERQWFKAKFGIDATETPRDIAFCAHAIRGAAVMVVPDATRDPRFADNPLVTGDPAIRFYAGAPIIDSDGHALGTVCVLDDRPRHDFDGAAVLAALARQVATQFELRRRIAHDSGTVASAQNYRNLLWSRAIDVMIVTDIAGHVVDANPAWEAMFGPPDPDRPISELFAGNEQLPLVIPAEGEEGIHVVRNMVTTTGKEVSIEWTLVRKHDHVFRIGRDQTRAVRAEEQLAHIQKMESLGQLTGGIAHDFNNLLTIILGNIDSAVRRLRDDNAAEVERLLGHAREASERAATLIQRLLAFARRQSLEPVRVDPAELVRQLGPLIEQSLGDAHDIAYRFGESIRPVEIDRAQLENSLINLVVNARDAMPDGGTITVTVGNAPAPDATGGAQDDGRDAGECVRIAVRDGGIGMDAATRRRIFEPFFTTKSEGKGTGLGLSQVMGFVTQSGGRVTVDSAPGEGSEISLWLPAHDETATAPGAHGGRGATGPAAMAGRPAGRVLLVEDNDRLRDHVGQLLTEAGYDLVEAGDGIEATALLAGDGAPPDLVLSDIRMPGLDGFQLSAEVRKRFPEVPILLMTGYAGRETPDYARHDAIIAKPFTAAKLLSQVETMLARAAAN